MESIISALQGWLTLYGLKVFGALLVLIIGMMLAKMLAKAAKKVMEKANVDATLVSFGSQIIRFFLIAVVIVAALNQLGVQTASLLAVLGAASLAVALALQSNLSSLAAGIMILLFRPFVLGQLIETQGTLGTVEHIGLMSTVLKCADGRTVLIPNIQIYGNKIVNYSARDVMRADLVIGIGYDDDIKKAKNVLNQIVSNYDKAKKDPPFQIFVLELADSSVNLAVRLFVDKDDYWRAKWDLSEAIKLRFDEEGIGIPYPQTDVHLYQVAQNQ